MMTPIPLPRSTAELTPAAPPVPDGFAEVTARISAGLPHVIALGGTLALGLVAPTGLARHWAGADPATVVADGTLSGDARASRIPLRLILRDGARLVGVAPLVLGPASFVPERGAPPILLGVRGFRIHAGALRGGSDPGSSVSLVWRMTTDTPPGFAAPSARLAILRRLEIRPPDEQDFGESLGAPEDAAAGPGSGRWLGYGRRFDHD